LSVAGDQCGSCGSATHGYCLNSGPNGTSNTETHLDKFSFSTDGNSSNVGDMAKSHNGGGNACASQTHGYGAGAYASCSGGIDGDAISKFAFANEATTSDVGNLTISTHGAGHAGCSSWDYGGFVFGGFGPSAIYTDLIDKFLFASDGNATDHANLTVAMRDMNGQSGLTHGYAVFGYSSGYVTDIQKFPYASQTNATDVGDISFQRGLSSGTASTTHGYSAGGIANPTTSPAKVTRISKNSHVTDGNEVDVADLTVARSHFSGTGTQI